MTQATTFFIGLPDQHWLDKLAEARQAGTRVIWVLTPDEAPKFACPYPDVAVLWRSDEELRGWLFESLSSWIGGTVNSLDDERLSRFARILGEIVNLVNFDQSSSKVLAKDSLPLRNAMRNWRWVEDGIPLWRTKGRGNGTAGVIVAAGPSLDAQWEDLARLRMHGSDPCFIVVGRTYTAAMQRGVWPEFVVEAEQFDWDDKIWMFAPQPPMRECILAAPLNVCPGVLRAWPAEKMILLDHAAAQLHGMRLGEDSIDGGNSVAHMAFNLAFYLGLNPICLAGVDLAYPEGAAKPTHAAGTFHHAWPSDILRQEMTHQEPLSVEANDGSQVRSSQPYVNFRLYFELQIAKFRKERPDLEVLSFSPRAQKIGGVRYVEVSTWTRSPSSSSPQVPPPGSSPKSESHASLSGNGSSPGAPSSISERSTKP